MDVGLKESFFQAQHLVWSLTAVFKHKLLSFAAKYAWKMFLTCGIMWPWASGTQPVSDRVTYWAVLRLCLDTWTAKKTKWWFDKRRREQTNNLKTEHRCISWACDSYFRGQLRLPGFKAAIKVFSVENPVLQHNNAPIVCSHQAKHKCD